MARAADALSGRDDAKLAKATAVVRGLVDSGVAPIVFCRFIATAEYVGEALRRALPADVTVEVVTGLLAADDRSARVEALREHHRRVLVATDCLSEGVNLQELFDAVVHYDLSWNPTRHEQREGRVDRYGQRKPQVRIVTLYGSTNPIDGIILSVLLRKHKAIRASTGISVPVPVDSNTVLEAILEGILMRGGDDQRSVDQLAFWEREVIEPQRHDLFEEWERAADREKASRSLFAHLAYPKEEVVRARNAARAAIGSGIDVSRFTVDALRAYGAVVTAAADGATLVEAREVRRAVRDAAAIDANRLRLRFEPPAGEDMLVGRTHPLVEGLATHTIDTALDSRLDAVARRAGVIRTHGVNTRTTALVVRIRFDLRMRARTGERTSIAEEVRVIGFRGKPEEPDWLSLEESDRLLDLSPSGNVLPEHAEKELERVLTAMDGLRPALERVAATRSADLAAEHERVRDVADLRGRTTVMPQLPVDILGVYVFLHDPTS
jgi:hypothetical protein